MGICSTKEPGPSGVASEVQQNGELGFETTPKNEVPGPGAHTLPVSKMSPSWTYFKKSMEVPPKTAD